MKFPPGFLWGASTAAYQVEGGITNNDWALADKVPKAGTACDHYHRYEQDFLLAKKLNHNAHRLSLEWSRLEPKAGEWDEEALEHYFHVLKFLKDQGFTTFVTLHHFTNPQWFAASGGWAKRDAVEYFGNYVSKIAQSLGQFIDFWVTINEPNLYTVLGYLAKIFPPFAQNLRKTIAVYRHLLSAHNYAYEIIHAYYPEAQVGFAQNFSWRRPERSESFWDKQIVKFLNWVEYDFTYRHTLNDFIGVNHYFDVHLKFTPRLGTGFVESTKHPGILTDRGWPIHGHALYQVLLKLKEKNLPIYITENGLADAQDQQRKQFLGEYLTAIHRAIKAGVRVKGYLHWSLLDNFEWEDGYQWKFGLVEVDFDDPTLPRRIRKSARFYAKVCKSNSLPPLHPNSRADKSARYWAGLPLSAKGGSPPEADGPRAHASGGKGEKPSCRTGRERGS